MRKKTFIFIGTCFLLLFVSLQGVFWLRRAKDQSNELPGADLQIVTTIFPLAAILQKVGGELVQVTTLLPAGVSPHTYEPTIEQAKAVSRADLLVYIGGSLDDWILKIAVSAQERCTAVRVLDFLEGFLLPVAAEKDAGGKWSFTGDRQAGDFGHHHSHYDPHVWTDPLLVKEKIAPALAEILTGISPANEKQFQHNLENFQAELQLLHEDIAAALHNCSEKRFITYHSSWNYFASRYNLGKPVYVEEFPGQEPAAKWLTALVELARELEIEVVFAEPQLSNKAAAVIAAEIGGQVLILDPLGGEKLPGRDSYNGLMRYNMEILQEGLLAGRSPRN